MDDVADIARLSRQITEANLLLQHVRRLAVEADSELSAIAHGRPPMRPPKLFPKIFANQWRYCLFYVEQYV